MAIRNEKLISYSVTFGNFPIMRLPLVWLHCHCSRPPPSERVWLSDLREQVWSTLAKQCGTPHAPIILSSSLPLLLFPHSLAPPLPTPSLLRPPLPSLLQPPHPSPPSYGLPTPPLPPTASPPLPSLLRPPHPSPPSYGLPTPPLPPTASPPLPSLLRPPPYLNETEQPALLEDWGCNYPRMSPQKTAS